MLMVTGKDSKSITVTLDPRPIRIWKAPSVQGAPKGTAPAGGVNATSSTPAKS
jgi:hypothetical protein